MKKQDFIALGIDDETAQKLAEQSEAELKGFVPKARFDEINEAKKSAEALVTERDEQIKGLQESQADSEGLQARIDELISENEKQKTAFTQQMRKSTLIEALRQTGAQDPEYVIYKMGGVDKFIFNEDGSVMALEDTLKNFKETNPFQFKDSRPGYEPAGGAPTPPDLSKMGYDELTAYLAKNPDAKLS